MTRFGFAALLTVVCPLCSQFETKLAPETVKAFDAYQKTAESDVENRWAGRRPFVSLAEREDERKRLMKGELVVRSAARENPMDVPDGLIHDWVGAVYMPNANAGRVVAVLEDFDEHAKIYPEIIRSRLIQRAGHEITGYWRIDGKQPFVPSVYDIRDEAHWEEIAPGRWICRAHAAEIREVEDAGSAKEHNDPPGEGLGLLWRLNAFWSVETMGSGVVAECRTVSLSRSIPSGMGWVVKRFVQNVPRESLASTLQNTRKEVERRGAR